MARRPGGEKKGLGGGKTEHYYNEFHIVSLSFHRADAEEIAIYPYVLDIMRGSFGMIPKNMSNNSEGSFGMIPTLPCIRFQRMWHLSSTHEV